MNWINNYEYIVKKIEQSKAKKIVIQIPEIYLIESILLQDQLKKQLKVNPEIYLLYDCNKKSCCTDIIGAKHVNYDILIHFGFACFSQKYCQKHIYVFPESKKQFEINSEILYQKKIDGILISQQYYVKYYEILSNKFKEFEVLKLAPYHDQKIDEYYTFGYYKTRGKPISNLLLLGCQSDFEQKMFLIKNKLKLSKIFNQKYQEVNINTNKHLLKRMSLINQIKNVQTFGILVSNASTEFCLESIELTKSILKQNHKNYYIFMMNNLSQTKLGNFPEIECYIIISCFNNCLYNVTDYHYLLVTPFDIHFAFNQFDMNLYDFDNRNNQKFIEQVQQPKIVSEQNFQKKQENALLKVQNQLEIKQLFQTLQFHQQRTFKGLEYEEKKEIKKLSKGKIGLAEQYKPLK